MFTGIITATTQINASKELQQGLKLTLKKSRGWDDLVLGESIAVNGVCLTISDLREGEWDTVLMPETLEKTIFGRYIPDLVNLERALPVGERLGGHIVQGHVDTIGTVEAIDKADGYRVTISFDKSFNNLVIDKGSITINGVSLTVTATSNNQLSVALIPHTLKNTTLSSLTKGSIVNLEFDILGKYILKSQQQN